VVAGCGVAMLAARRLLRARRRFCERHDPGHRTRSTALLGPHDIALITTDEEPTVMTQHNLQQRVTIPLPRPETDDLLDVATAADHLGTPVRFIRRLIAERRIRFYKIGRYVRIDRRDLDAFVAEGRIDPIRSPRR
jgi:excisionase family DNA binding protein